MRNIKLTVAYDGTNYAGWQRQSNAPTIQGMLEQSIHLMTREHITVHGAGRTDAGVHAHGMVANFKTEVNIPCQGFVKGLNSILPADIRITSAEHVEPEFHARCSAKGKRYVYNLALGQVQLPTERLYAHMVHGEFDMEAVAQSLPFLVGIHDFTSFEAAGSRDQDFDAGRGGVREIYSAALHVRAEDPSKMQIIIAGDGFLRHMVRNIVGTLIEVGQGKRSIDQFIEVIAARDRTKAGPTAPAKGLFLHEVYY